MVDFKQAYELANNFFLENDYAGVRESRETDESWLFSGKCKCTSYGTMDACVPKNGSEPYVFSTTDEVGLNMWENAKVVSV